MEVRDTENKVLSEFVLCYSVYSTNFHILAPFLKAHITFAGLTSLLKTTISLSLYSAIQQQAAIRVLPHTALTNPTKPKCYSGIASSGRAEPTSLWTAAFGSTQIGLLPTHFTIYLFSSDQTLSQRLKTT